MTRPHMLLPAALLAASSPPVLASTTSWGRPGVSLADYRSDAIACARSGADTDIRDDPATREFVAAEALLDRTLNAPSPQTDLTGDSNDSVGMIRRRLNPDRKIAQLQRTLTAATERCLRDRGYAPFVLTRDQDRRLRRLKPGSEARRAYLHGLAADPSVLSAQAVGGAAETRGD